jgi:hypothetical protein
MPNRWLAVAITLFWAAMMAMFLERDVLPHWRLNQRPDFRAVTKADPDPEPVRWAVMQGDDRVGTAETEWVKRSDGWSEFRSKLEFKELPFASTIVPQAGPGGLRWQSSFLVSPDGDLDHFEILVFWGESKPTMTIAGKVEKEIMKVSFRSGSFTHEEQFYYEPHSLVMTALTPIDKLPNLHVGQTWEHHVMNPIFHTTDTVRCQVKREQVITWRGEPVPTYVVEQAYGQIRAHCWVAYDGTVLRQEVPLGANPFVLEHE